MKHDTKPDVYQIITDRILALLDAGVNPWRKPWHAAAWKPPQNLLSRRPYRGVNVLLLGLSPYSSPYWVSFKQALQAGGSVKKGEKASLAVFWKLYDSRETDKADPSEREENTRLALLPCFQRGAVRRRSLPAAGRRPELPA
jgi:antirestriction protein ArdC